MSTQQEKYDKIMHDTINYALLSDKCLEIIKDESDMDKRFELLKKYFVENITKNFYEKMDLLNMIETNFDEFKKMYIIVAKNLFSNISFAVQILVSQKKCYSIENNFDIANNIMALTSEK